MKRNRIIALCAAVLWMGASSAGAITYKGDLETEESVVFPEQTGVPSSPPAGQRKLYFKDDGGLYQLDSSGNENPVMLGGFKNAIINGNFDIWQRGTSFNDPNGNYGPDRFIMFRNGNNTVTFSRQSFTLGQTDVPGEPQYYLRWEKTAGTDGPPELRQRIESVRTFAGETVTASFWAKADSARDLNITFNQRFGSGGTPSSVMTTGAGTCTLTTNWTLCVGTATLPGLSGKTLGTNGDDNLEWRLTWSNNSNGTVDIARVQVEKGAVATPFERRPIGAELALCQRYYTESGDGIDGQVLPGSSTDIALAKGFPVEMRSAPSVSILSASPTIVEIGGAGRATGSGSAIASSWTGSRAAVVRINGFSGLTGGRQVVINNSGVPVISFDAEL